MKRKMKIGILLKPFFPDEVEKMSEEIAGYGYETVDFQGLINTSKELYNVSEREFESILGKDREIIKRAGLEISQTHGPWRYPIMDSTPGDRAERFEKMVKSIRGTAILGCGYVVLHPIMPFGKEDDDPSAVWDINIDHFSRLAEIAKEYGVVICLENMPFEGQSQARARDTLRLIRDIGSENVAFCLDTGHCARTKESPADAVLSDRLEYLRVLHVHDNDGSKDSHSFPGSGITDWKAFSDSLYKVGFKGSLSLETRVKPEETSPEDYDSENRKLFASAKKIAENAF